MAEPTIERGRFDWGAGRGYQPPADTTGTGSALPPGWNTPPHLEQPAEPQADTERMTAREFVEQHPVPLPYPEARKDAADVVEPLVQDLNEEAMIVAAYYAGALAPVPQDRVNLDDGTAVYKQHTIELSQDGISIIKTVLAMEVCRMLDEEKARVAIDAGLFIEQVQEPGRAGASNMPKVLGPTNTMEPEAPPAEGNVQ